MASFSPLRTVFLLAIGLVLPTYAQIMFDPVKGTCEWWKVVVLAVADDGSSP
jgi:hypothetical protein